MTEYLTRRNAALARRGALTRELYQAENAAFQALNRKRSPEENRGILATAAELTVAGVHRDYFARVVAHARK